MNFKLPFLYEPKKKPIAEPAPLYAELPIPQPPMSKPQIKEDMDVYERGVVTIEL